MTNASRSSSFDGAARKMLRPAQKKMSGATRHASMRREPDLQLANWAEPRFMSCGEEGIISGGLWPAVGKLKADLEDRDLARPRRSIFHFGFSGHAMASTKSKLDGSGVALRFDQDDKVERGEILI